MSNLWQDSTDEEIIKESEKWGGDIVTLFALGKQPNFAKVDFTQDPPKVTRYYEELKL